MLCCLDGSSGQSKCCSYFFPSRGRHTSLQGDWSSDVCSSDLASGAAASAFRASCRPRGTCPHCPPCTSRRAPPAPPRDASSEWRLPPRGRRRRDRGEQRSEERRVGKERRPRGRPDERRKERAG